MRTNKYILLAATLLGLSSCGNKRGDYDASGTFEATEVIVSSEANGKIMQFNIEEGQLLKAGEEVGCIDTLQLYLKKMQLLASGKAIASKSTDINKQIAATKEQIGKAEYERKRTENLLKENAATQKQIDDIDSQIAVLKKQLEAGKESAVQYHRKKRSSRQPGILSLPFFLSRYVSGLCGPQTVCVISGHDLVVNQPRLCTTYQR